MDAKSNTVEEPETSFNPVTVETKNFPRMTPYEVDVVPPVALFTPEITPEPTPTPTPTPNSTTKTKATPKTVSTTVAKTYAKYLVGTIQFVCLNKLWEKESRWNPLAKNKISGAYGIPQALPGDKMKSAGSDWRTNPITQIKWGVGYIKDRYGTSCSAWNFWLKRGWY